MSLKPIDSVFALDQAEVPRPWSIVLRLVLLFTVAAAVMLLFAMAAAYWFVMQHVEHDNDRYLTDKLAARRADITADAGPASLGRELNMIQAGDKGYAVRVIDPAGQIVAESPRMRTLLPVDVFPGILSIQGQRPSTALYRARDGKTFALVTSVADVGEQIFTLQLAQERTHDERFRARYAGLLTGMVGCAVVTWAGVALLVTRRGLRPFKASGRNRSSALARRVCTSGFRLPVGRRNCSPSRLPSIRCSPAWRIRLAASHSSRPTSRMSCARPSPSCAARRRAP